MKGSGEKREVGQRGNEGGKQWNSGGKQGAGDRWGHRSQQSSHAERGTRERASETGKGSARNPSATNSSSGVSLQNNSGISSCFTTQNHRINFLTFNLCFAIVARSKGALIQEALGVEEYGVIISLRPSFGFIQYIHSDEQVYFSEHDVYEGVKIGDIVSFTAHQSPKGLAASRIKHIDDSVDLESLSTKVLGTISRIPERHRSNCGLLEVELSSLPNDLQPLLRRKPVNTIAYRPKDLNSSQMPRTTLLERGDFVEFTLSRIPGCGLLLGTDIHLKKLKREREREKSLAQQMQRMLDAGAVREVGVVTAIKNKEYGFIKSQDRKDELYFRMDGFLGDEDTVIREVYGISNCYLHSVLCSLCLFLYYL